MRSLSRMAGLASFFLRLAGFLPVCAAGEEQVRLQYPVILVHGIAAVDRLPVDMWGRIPRVLRTSGVQVYLGNTDAWGSYESNAAILKATIDRVLEETGAGKVNIIAHSKGGIDSRYTIWRYGYGDKVASLTTLGTPHLGSELADTVNSRQFIHRGLARRALETFGRFYGDQNPNLNDLIRQLTTGYMRSFNEQVTLDDQVYFQSYYSTIASSLDEPVFFFTRLGILMTGGENDGVVSEKSAQWGPNQHKIEGNLSHIDLIDLKMELQTSYDVPGLYLRILQDLAARGF